MTNDLLEKPLTTNPKINHCHKKEIIDRLVMEEPQRSIAKSYGISQNRIHQINKANQPLIQQKKQEILETLPDVVHTVKTDVNTNKRLSQHIALDFRYVTPELVSLKSVLNKTNDTVLKIASHDDKGILPSRTPLINLTQDNRTQTTVISDNVLNLFSNHAESLVDSEVIDVIEDTTSVEDSGNDE